jgi:retinol dehydrogenase-12
VINTIRESHPSSKGALHYLHLDLNDLTTIKASAQDFLSREKRLDVLFNNAGVMVPPQGSKTAQGYELQLGTNCVAPFLFTKLLHSILIRTAALPGTQQGSVRIVWVASSATEHFSPKGGVDMENLDYRSDKAAWTKYGVSKAGNYYHSVETARLLRDKGVVSVALNPGNLKTELTRHVPVWQRYLFEGTLLYDAKFGAYTELFAGLSPEVSMATTGCWIQPWGRILELRRKDIEAGGKSEEEGGTGIARRFWEWCEGETAKYA